MNKQPNRVHISNIGDNAITCATDKGFVKNLENLHTLIETMSGSDGVQVLLKAMQISIRAYGNEPFILIPVLVQTAGTITSTVSMSNSVIASFLDAATDDVLGFYPLSDMKMSRKVPYVDYGEADEIGIEISVPIPQHILQLLTKESETERLQSLSLVVVGKFLSNTGHMDIYHSIMTKYLLRRKSIVIR